MRSRRGRWWRGPSWSGWCRPASSNASRRTGGRRSTWRGRERSRPACHRRASTGEASLRVSDVTWSWSGRRRPVAAATGEGPGPADAPPLPFAHPAPDPELLAVGQRVLEALVADDAAPAHLLG